MRRLRAAAVVSILLLAIAPWVKAQERQPVDGAEQMIARSEARHVRARQNLLKILQAHPQFMVELQAMSARLKTEPAWLLNVMACESLFNQSARNSLPGQTASGLLQWIESTARSLGTTTSAIRRMNPVEQLRFVERYLTPFQGRLNSLGDVYLAVLRGFVIEGDDSTLVSPLDNSRRERRIYTLNRQLDLDGDRKITKGELALNALSIGRFHPATMTSEQLNGPLSPEPLTITQPPLPTRSIFIRPSDLSNQQ